jgi:hypothetical protein
MSNDDKRDEQLIEEREQYEKEYFSHVIDDMVESSALDKLILDRLQYFDDNFDFEPSQEYLHLEKIYSNGPDFDESSNNPNFYDDEVSNQIENYDPVDFYDDIRDEILMRENDDENHLKDLIDEHVKDEKAFFDSMLIEVIQEEHYFEKAIDDIIMEQLEAQFEEYEREKFVTQFEDYEIEYDEPYWYDDPMDDNDCYWDEVDESAVDPFDSFGEIDYPECESSHVYPDIIDYDSDMQEDFERYQKRKEHLFGYGYDELPEPEDDLILDVDEEYCENNVKYGGNMEFLDIENLEEKRNQKLIMEHEKIESLYKDYFTKDDTLDNIIKEKLKEKKFNV